MSELANWFYQRQRDDISKALAAAQARRARAGAVSGNFVQAKDAVTGITGGELMPVIGSMPAANDPIVLFPLQGGGFVASKLGPAVPGVPFALVGQHESAFSIDRPGVGVLTKFDSNYPSPYHGELQLFRGTGARFMSSVDDASRKTLYDGPSGAWSKYGNETWHLGTGGRWFATLDAANASLNLADAGLIVTRNAAFTDVAFKVGKGSVNSGKVEVIGTTTEQLRIVRATDGHHWANFNCLNKVLDIAEGGQIAGFAGSFTTERFRINAANGDASFRGVQDWGESQSSYHYLYGELRMPTSTSASIAVGAAAGTGASASIFGNHQTGRIVLTTGSNSSGLSGVLFTITWPTGRWGTNYSLVLWPADPDAAAMNTRVYADDGSRLTSSIQVNSQGGMNNSTTYIWYYYAQTY